MKLSPEQYFALDLMGIPVWVSRQDERLTPAESQNEAEHNGHIDYSKPWLVITEELLTAAENRLLNAIFSSIDIQLDDVMVITQQQIKMLDGFSADKTIALVLGETLSQKLNMRSHAALPCKQLENCLLALVSPSLKQLLNQPQNKVKMWQTILQLRNLKAPQFD